MAKDLGDFLIERRIIGKDQLAEARGAGQSPMAARCTKSWSSRAMRPASKSCRPWPTCTATSSSTCADVPIPPSVVELVPESVARENAVIPLVRRRRRAQGHHERPVRLRHVRKAAVHSEPQSRNRPGHHARASSRRSTATTARGRRIGRLDAAGVHRHGHRLHRDRRRPAKTAAAKTSTKPAPRSSGWCT